MGHTHTGVDAGDGCAPASVDDEALLVVNTADTDRTVSLHFARDEASHTRELSLRAGGYASVAAPDGEGDHSVAVDTDAGGRAAVADVPWLPMVVVRERAVQLC